MVKPRRDLDLAHEPVGTERRGELGLEHLDGHFPFVLEIFREVDRRHPARTQLPLDAIAVGKRSRQTPQRVIHCRLFPRGSRLNQFVTITGWFVVVCPDPVAISSRNRSGPSAAASSGRTTLMATLRCLRSSAR